MLPTLDTHIAALKLERELAFKRADRLAPLLAAATALRSAPAPIRVETAIARWGRLKQADRSLRWLLRPSNA